MKASIDALYVDYGTTLERVAVQRPPAPVSRRGAGVASRQSARRGGARAVPGPSRVRAITCSG